MLQACIGHRLERSRVAIASVSTTRLATSHRPSALLVATARLPLLPPLPADGALPVLPSSSSAAPQAEAARGDPPCRLASLVSERRRAITPLNQTEIQGGGLGGAPASPSGAKGRIPKPRAMVPACGPPKLHAHRPCRRQSRASRGRAGRGQRVPRGIRGLHAGRLCRCDAETRCRIRLPPPHGRRSRDGLGSLPWATHGGE